MSERESMAFDVVIVGAGPAGLSAAIRLAQLAQINRQELSICVVEKGSEVGAHILSGAVVDPRALDELLPDWQAMGAPLTTAATRDEMYLLTDAERAVKLPNALVPATMHNVFGEGERPHYIASVGNLCRWLAEQATELGVEIYPGFPASEILYNEAGAVIGVATGDMGVGADGQPLDTYTPGMNLLASYTIFAEGCRGHLGKQLYQRFKLDRNSDPQHYGIGFKELWDIPAEQHQPGLVIHGAGWPLSGSNKDGASGGFFLYHGDNQQVMVGLIVDLNYRNPWLSPYDEFQQLKHHPLLAAHLQGGKRVAYGARAIAKGGFNALPIMHFPGGLLAGCEAGTLNFARIKGTHTAMKSGMLAAEEVFGELISSNQAGKDLSGLAGRIRHSWLYDELYRSRNFGPALHRFGALVGGAVNFVDQNLLALPFTLRDRHEDWQQMKTVHQTERLEYPKPDGVLSFDKASSVYLSNTAHEENQPCHLKLADASIPMAANWPDYAEPAQRYCPAGVYEVVELEGSKRLQINGQNCLHCKTCDIKDPAGNITWVTPEGGGGPNYPNF
ncbi:electron transfer flavoprotein-ubiquinone oxidoreductase [Parathalassolituus penaei]|uniref:Electron transfer flavoprotein-ubiquinone oxidoreductase n=1 Tax=Parathalassolituus penaei TaxID=2997323 RepID=A0A9X3IRF5_9GAMM|nr:electron transfer flavoprotein-ubiquinone oxidoreductase [Parathalassolituus penaei]MCY0963789.1 electron transfer flavoprotein-ubiquinone oxidoreductase [Parathalassolituus penaei]